LVEELGYKPDTLVKKVVSRIGNLDAAYIAGSFAEGVNSDTMELVLTGEDLDNGYIQKLMEKAEKQLDRKIIYIVITGEQLQHYFKNKPTLLIWEKDKSE
jgi:fructose-1-phosphate kinase PfkB-like protein